MACPQPLERIASGPEIELRILQCAPLRRQFLVEFTRTPLGSGRKTVERAALCPGGSGCRFGTRWPGLRFSARGIRRLDFLEPLGPVCLRFRRQLPHAPGVGPWGLQFF